MFRPFYVGIVFLLTGTVLPCFSQDTLWQTSLKTYPMQARLMSTDKVGNLYVVKENNMLIRYNAAGDSDRVFNEIKKGSITQIDAGNPLRILLFFQEYQMVVVLDNMLSQKNVIRLNNLGLFNVTSIANSADGSFWAFDAAQGLLLKIDDKPSIRFSTPLRNVLEEAAHFQYMVEEDRVLYASDKDIGVFKFDLYGFYNTTYHFPMNEFQWFNNQLVYWKSPELVVYHTQSLKENRLVLPHPETVKQVRVDRNKVFIRREDGIEVFTLP